MAWLKLKQSYLRKGYSIPKIMRGLKRGAIRVRTIDVGRRKHHYIHVYYTKAGKLVGTTFGKFKRKKI
jgi:hypothetical protein